MTGMLLLVRLLLSVVLGLAGVTKLADPAGTRQSIRDFGVPRFLLAPLGWLLPLTELACAAALIFAASAWWGAAGTLALLLLFMAGITVSLVRGRLPDCHCFGQLHSSPVGWQTLVRNAVFCGMAGLIVFQGREKPAVSYIGWLESLTRLDAALLAFTVALAAVALFCLWSVFHLLSQNGRLLLRLEAVETKLGITTPAAPPVGLPVNSPAPRFSLRGLDSRSVTLDMLRKVSDDIVLIFTEPGCGSCEGLLSEVAHWQREHASRLTIAIVSRGDLEVNRAKAAQHNLRNVLLQDDRETYNAYHGAGTPSAVLVRGGRIATTVAAGADAIRTLLEEAVLPRPLLKGDPAPALEFPDLNGHAVNLGSLRDRRTLLLFWNPSCGFCQEMLDDLKAWERNPPRDAPQLLIVSTGLPEDNRAQGFRATVLLDENLQAVQLFGAEGTPAAVILDQDGRVASKVGVGAEEVLALARGARERVTVK